MNTISQLMLQLAARSEGERLLAIKQSWDTYFGRLPNALKDTKSDPQAKDNVKLAYGRLLVDTGVSFLLGDGVDFEVEIETPDTPIQPDQPSPADPRNVWLDEVWDYNKKDILLTEMATNGGVTGHAFLRVFPPTPKTKNLPRIITLDTANVTPFWETDDYKDVFAYKIQWNAMGYRRERPTMVVRKQEIVRSDTGKYWTITDYELEGEYQNTLGSLVTSGRWIQLGQPQTHPYEWSPIFNCQNLISPNDFWGLSDLTEDVVELNRAMNFVLSNNNRIIRNHAHPIPVAKGFTPQILDTGEGQIVVIPTEDGSLDYLEFKGDLNASNGQYKTLKEAFHAIGRLPEVATGKVDGIGALSGVALKLLYGPFVAKTKAKQSTYGEMLEHLNTCLLEMNGEPADTNVCVKWCSPVPVDDKETVDTALVKEQLGVSKETLIEELGYDAHTEQVKKEAEMQLEADRQIQTEQAMANIGDQVMRQFNRGQ